MTLDNLRRLFYLCSKARTSYSESIEIEDKWEILEELGIKEADAESIHRKLDQLLLEYVGDKEITDLFNSIHKYYI